LDRARLDALGLKTMIVKQPAVVEGHAFTSGQIPRLTGFERPPAAARLVAGPSDSACAAFVRFPIGTLRVATSPGALVTDTFQGEHATGYHVRDRGLVVITSCGHAGVINSVRQCQKVSGIDRVHAIVGGFHLAAASDEIVAKTVEAFKQIDPDYIIPAHCSGLAAIVAVQRELPKKLVLPSTGTRVIFGG
jgi:7,8-dihydropterin-6-yl-methyl-4-(beta-D-ribofuranosyl)aminobenzene 5'-phosphate synthase